MESHLLGLRVSPVLTTNYSYKTCDLKKFNFLNAHLTAIDVEFKLISYLFLTPNDFRMKTVQLTPRKIAI